MSERYQVRVTKDYLVFCSGHFISYEGDKCERLHGHNYRAAIEVEGPLDENFYVFDFIALKNRTEGITDELDHRMMLPTQEPRHSACEDAAQRQRALQGPRMAFSARGLRAVADREHDGGTAGPLHRRTAARGDLRRHANMCRRCCASRWKRVSGNRQRGNGGRFDHGGTGELKGVGPASYLLQPASFHVTMNMASSPLA